MHIFYNFYFKKKYITVRYSKILRLIYDMDIKHFSSFRTVSFNFIKFYNFFFFEYSFLYNLLFQKFTFEYFYYKNRKKKKKIRYNLLLTFHKKKLFMNINDIKKRDYFFLSTGFFIKYFEKKKLYKKSKIIKTLMIKFLRKIFLLIKFPTIILILKKTPIFLLEFLSLFHQPIPHKFNEPLTNREIIDTSKKSITKIAYFIFLNSENYVNNKTKKKGRIKRKISRKIIIKNKIID